MKRLAYIPFSFRRWLWCLIHGHTIRVQSHAPDREYCRKRRERGGYIPASHSRTTAYWSQFYGGTTRLCVICGCYRRRDGGNESLNFMPPLTKRQQQLAIPCLLT
jgi:hypothetical protein